MQSINPFNAEVLANYEEFSEEQVLKIINQNYSVWQQWKEISFAERAAFMMCAAEVLRERKTELATLITQEMGKRISESIAEVEKCAWVCELLCRKC